MLFSEKIKNIEARINQLKTLGLSSSSSLASAETTIVIPFQIIATRIVSGEVLDADSSKIAYVRINTSGNASALLAIRLISPTNFGDRVIAIKNTLQNLGGAKYGFQIQIYGSDADIDALNNGQTLPVENYTFKILSTSNITYSIVYEDREIQ